MHTPFIFCCGNTEHDHERLRNSTVMTINFGYADENEIEKRKFQFNVWENSSDLRDHNGNNDSVKIQNNSTNSVVLLGYRNFPFFQLFVSTVTMYRKSYILMTKMPDHHAIV